MTFTPAFALRLLVLVVVVLAMFKFASVVQQATDRATHTGFFRKV